MERTFRHARQTVTITHNEDKQHYEWQIEKGTGRWTRARGMAC